jgi:hypothetical protein
MPFTRHCHATSVPFPLWPVPFPQICRTFPVQCPQRACAIPVPRPCHAHFQLARTRHTDIPATRMDNLAQFAHMARTLAHQLAYFPHQSRASTHKVRTWLAQSRTNSLISRTRLALARKFPHKPAHYRARRGHSRTLAYQHAYFPHQSRASTGKVCTWLAQFRTKLALARTFPQIPAPCAHMARALPHQLANFPHQARTGAEITAQSRTLSRQARTFPHIGAPTRIFPAPVSRIYAQSAHMAREIPH